ncbi:HalOD1 output domain-containing protein [Halopiger djelfimassiliensis]|uniref:HalOD1 output domain-containing protein n=1 Tax=Halopiger djelfimassiliensis TaxID=1293047 RepID=UPI000677CE3B|nr:HalOD1 output domain-containing protein [Halopiger djelfimassiliensis]
MHPTLVTALARIAAHEGCDRTTLPPLYDSIDPEALAALLESNADVTVRFEYEDYRVVIGPDEVTVTDADR